MSEILGGLGGANYASIGLIPQLLPGLPKIRDRSTNTVKSNGIVALMTYQLKIIASFLGCILLIGIFQPQSTNLDWAQRPRVSSLFTQTAQIEELAEIPIITGIYNLGNPAGNITAPRYLALNHQASQLYILSEGAPEVGRGNGLSVYNIQSGEFTQQIKLNHGDNIPLDLQFDEVSGLIYALWHPRYEEAQATLAVIDSQSKQIIQEIMGIRTIAAGNGRLYAANDEKISYFEVPGNSLAEIQQVDLALAATGSLAFSAAANQLYLARGIDGDWRVDIFDADTLMLMASYQAEGQVLNILPRPANDEILIVVAQADFRLLYRVTTRGELADLPYELGPGFDASGIALSPDEQTLYYSNGLSADAGIVGDGPTLVGLSVSSLVKTHQIPIVTNIDNLVIDADADQAFGIFPFDHLLYTIDLTNETADIVNTAITVRDILVDEISDRIFVTDSANRVRQLNRQSLDLIAEVRLSSNPEDYGFKAAGWSGELALDPARNRLYISGIPAIVLEADSLTEIATLEPGGQLALGASSDNIYVSQCGVTIFDAETLSENARIPGSAPRSDGLSPNPCVTYSQLDSQNQLLYSIAPNGVPGSNGGTYLYVYDLSLEPTLVFSDTDISIVSAEPDALNRRAFVSQIRHSNRRLRSLTVPEDNQIHYTTQLMGLWGDPHYSPNSNRLYVSDQDYSRLLTLDADRLSVIGETLLPPNDMYRLVDLDTANEQIYLAGSYGQLLIASTDGERTGPQDREDSMISLPRTPDGRILSLEQRGEDTLARIEISIDEYIFEPRLYRTSSNNQAWISLNQNLPTLPVQALAVSPGYGSDHTLFSGLLAPGHTGGLYKSTDKGQTWQTAMNGLGDLWIDKLFISPDFGQTGLIFANSAYGGLHQSNDGGQSWTPLTLLNPNNPFPTAQQANSAAMSDNGIVLISQAIGEAPGIFKATIDPNSTTITEWQQSFDIPMTHLSLSPGGDVALGFGNGLWRSTDGGVTWEAGGMGLTGIDNLQPNRIMFSSAFTQDRTIYFYFTDMARNGPTLLFRSTDAGLSWQPWVSPVGDERVVTSLTLTHDGVFLLGDNKTEVTQLASTDINWTAPTEPTITFPIDDIAVSPTYGVDQTLFAISAQYGLFKSDDSGQRWISTSFPARAYGFSLNKYQLAISPDYSQDQIIYVATGRSLHRSTDGGESWEDLHLMSKDSESDQKLSFQAQKIAISPDFARDQILLASTPTKIYRSTDQGDSWQAVLTSAEEAATTDILSFGPDSQTSYARFGYGHSLFTSHNGGEAQSWQERSGNRDELFSAISTATDSDGTLTIAVEFDRRLLQTTAQTPPWQDISSNLPEALTSVSAVAYGPNNTLYIGGQGKLFVSIDNGYTWQDLTRQAIAPNNLPPDATITNLHVVDMHLFITTDSGGIFVSADHGVTWTNISVIN